MDVEAVSPSSMIIEVVVAVAVARVVASLGANESLDLDAAVMNDGAGDLSFPGPTRSVCCVNVKLLRRGRFRLLLLASPFKFSLAVTKIILPVEPGRRKMFVLLRERLG